MILGIFTGQGAQWPTMGRELTLHCRTFRETMHRLEGALRSIPEAPDWVLQAELMKQEKTSRVHEAIFSQPMTTAIQIGLINLLREVGINFNAVVGHSSGEIAAAYSAGLLNEKDAICISYYRGLFAKLSHGKKGEDGRMIAVGMSMEQAQNYIASRPALIGRIGLAASNSPLSVTLSGDTSAVADFKTLMDLDGIFFIILKVEVA